MINLKKINQIREGISLRGRSASQYGNIIGPKHGMDDDSLENIPYHPKTEGGKKLKAALTKLSQDLKDHPKLKEAKDPREYDYEGDMAKSQLRSIISNAQEIHDMLEDNTNIAEWVQSKITLSADYITTVRDYMNSEVNEASDPKMTKPSLLTRVKKMNKQNKERSQAAFSNMFGGGNPASSLSIRKKSTNEEVELDEAVSKAKDLKTLLTRHSELAIAANKDGDHEAVKYHQAKMNDVKNKMAKLAKEEVEPIYEISKELAKSYLDKTVDPVYGMPKHGMKDRMKGIRQASIRVLKKAGKTKHMSETTAEKAMKQHHKWLKTLEGQTSDSIASKLAKAKESEANHQAEINAKLKSGEMKHGGFEHKSMVTKWNRLSRNARDLETKHSWLKAKEAKNKN